MTSYIIAQCNSRRKLTQQDILKFKWEDMGAMMHKKESVVMSDDELKRLKNLANALSSAQFVEIDNVTDIYAKDKKSDIRHEGSQ